MTPPDDDALEVKLGGKWGKLALAAIAGSVFGAAGGGATGTWLAPQASAQSIETAARKAATEAISSERERTNEIVKRIDGTLDENSRQLDRLEDQNVRQDDKLDRILEAVARPNRGEP